MQKSLNLDGDKRLALAQEVANAVKNAVMGGLTVHSTGAMTDIQRRQCRSIFLFDLPSDSEAAGRSLNQTSAYVESVICTIQHGAKPGCYSYTIKVHLLIAGLRGQRDVTYSGDGLPEPGMIGMRAGHFAIGEGPRAALAA